MAYPGNKPGATTWPGVDIPPMVAPIPEPRSGPQGLRARDVLVLQYRSAGGLVVTRRCPPDLTFSSVAPGGFDAMSATVPWPSDWPRTRDIAQETVARVVDSRNGEEVWYGRVVDPDAVTAQGYGTVLDGEAAALAYVDRDLNAWVPADGKLSGNAQVVDGVSLPQHPDDWVDPTRSIIELAIPDGTRLRDGDAQWVQYLQPKYGSSGQDIVAILASAQSNRSGPFRAQLRVRNATDFDMAINHDISTMTTVDHWTSTEGGGGWDMTDARSADLRLEFDTVSESVFTADNNFRLRVGNVAVRFGMLTRTGGDLAYKGTEVTHGMVVNDVIGRFLRDAGLDVARDAIAQPDTRIEQAAWWQGVTARGIFEFLEDLDPGYYWAVWGPQATRFPRFEYKEWRGRPRYMIPPGAARLRLAGGGDDLFNRAVVTYQSARNTPASVVVAGVVPELDAVGAVRTTVVDVTGDGPMSQLAAQRRGLAALERLGLQRSSGSAVVSGPVLDRKWGRMVEPWELRAGCTAFFSEASPRMAGTGLPYSAVGKRDGLGTFRVTATSFRAESNECELTLDGGNRDVFNRVRRRPPARRSTHQYQRMSD